ncbi:MAG TPA: peptidoglycan DD-metalloendopeptidase family protein [Gemmatimonadales bacterium]|nr:peptidoglycan DD-metalloendopeptidase family protein [Gemmatimonadales bacterium]
MKTLLLALLLATPLASQGVDLIPDSTGWGLWGVHVLTLAHAPDSAIWVGTYGHGIFVWRPHATSWEQIAENDDTSKHSISWDFVHAFAFGPKGEVWYGTVGNGWGLSLDNGNTWKNWQYRELGPEWQYVAPNGIATRGDTTYIATADGLKITGDDGKTWLVVTDSMGATTAKDSVIGRIRNQYLLAITLGDGGNMWVSELTGIAHSPDGGRTWHEGFFRPPCSGEGCENRARAFATDSKGVFWIRTEDGVFKFGPQFGGWKASADSMPKIGLPITNWEGPAPKIVAQMAALPSGLRHTWFRRPIDLADQPYIDQTYRFGSTMGGNFQAHQGVEFNNPDGTPVHAIGDGVVVYSGKAEAGANTIAIRHDKKLDGKYLFSVYYHNSKLLVKVGDRVKTGDVISLVGNTGRATNDHLHLEVHVAPTTDSEKIVDPEVRYPPFNVNPELWIEPMPGTGVVAGQVWDSKGQPLQQARIYGLVKPEPQETPLSYVETYGPRNHEDPSYHEHFAIGDVPAGEYTMGVEIEGKRVYRNVKVEAGKLTWVEFRPDAH